MQSTSETITITAASRPLNAPNIDGTTAVVAVSGTAAFDQLILYTVGVYVLEFSAGVLRTSATIIVEVGSVAALTVLSQPSNCMNGVPMFTTPSVVYKDRGDNVVPSAIASVSVSIAQNSRGASLTGLTSVDAVSGVASFPGLAITGTGNGFTLRFTAGNLSVETVQFNVHGASVTSLSVLSFPAGVIWNDFFAPAVRVALLDANLNVITGGAWRPPYATIRVEIHPQPQWTVRGTFTGTPLLQLLGTTQVAVREGVAVFTDLRLSGAGPTFDGVQLLFTTNISASIRVASPFFSTSRSPSRLRVDRNPIEAQISGVPLNPFPRISVVDGTANVVRGLNVSLRVALIAANSAVLAGTTSLVAVGGMFVFTDLSISKASGAGDPPYVLSFEVCDLEFFV